MTIIGLRARLLTSALRCRPHTNFGELRQSRFLGIAATKARINDTKRTRCYSTTENINVSHSRFLAESSPGSHWKPNERGKERDNDFGDFDKLIEGKGKLSPTSSHLFKLILPLGQLSDNLSSPNIPLKDKKPPPTVILLHPSQPLSHVAQLIQASISPTTSISFHSTSSNGQQFQWSASTDVGDFIRAAAHAAQFSIQITNHGSQLPDAVDSETTIEVEVPTFADRTRFLQRRLTLVDRQLKEMEELKNACDREARRGVQRMALGGFGLLVVYWGGVARLTFWDYGWDVMEPITYLSGLSTVICGYLWFLYQGREVSYSSVLDRSISSRRETLYKAKGLDIELWVDLMSEARSLRKEIGRIAEDYDKEKSSEDVNEGEVKAKEDGKSPEGKQRVYMADQPHPGKDQSPLE